MCGINSQLESQESELHHANQWALESRRMFEELKTKSRLYQENHALDCLAIEELRRICHEETERARQLRTDEFCAQKKEEPSAMNQLLSQIWTLQDSEELWNVPRSPQPSRIPSPRGMLSRDSGLPHHTRNSMGTSGKFLKNH